MSQPSSDNALPSSASTGRWQFSLHGLLILMLAAAFAVSRVQVPQASWDNHVLAVIAFLFVIGLLHQAWDLRSAHRDCTWPSSDERDGWLSTDPVLVLLLGMAAIREDVKRFDAALFDLPFECDQPPSW